MNKRKGVPWTTQATSRPLADFESIRLLDRKSTGDFEVIIDPELENGEVIMANTRKSVKPKAGAKPTSKEIYEDSGVLELIEDTGGTVDDLPDLYGEDDSDETENEVSYTPTAEEIAAVLAYIKSNSSETVAGILLDDSFVPVPLEKPAKELFVKVYDVVDTITGTSIRPEDNGALTLSGRVTDADLDAAGVDKAWLLRIGAIVDAGYEGG